MKARVVDTLKEYPWSSHQGYLSGAAGWGWLYKKPVLSKFSDDPALPGRRYRRYMAQDDSAELERVFSLKKLPAVLGNKQFLQSIKDKFFGEKLHQEIPESRSLAPSPREIFRVVCEEYVVTEDDLLISRRGETNEPRNVAIFLLRSLRGETLPFSLTHSAGAVTPTAVDASSPPTSSSATHA